MIEVLVGSRAEGCEVDLDEWCGLELTEDQKEFLWNNTTDLELIESAGGSITFYTDDDLINFDENDENDENEPSTADCNEYDYYSVYCLDEDQIKSEMQIIITDIIENIIKENQKSEDNPTHDQEEKIINISAFIKETMYIQKEVKELERKLENNKNTIRKLAKGTRYSSQIRGLGKIMVSIPSQIGEELTISRLSDIDMDFIEELMEMNIIKISLDKKSMKSLSKLDRTELIEMGYLRHNEGYRKARVSVILEK